jgi:hypothetical protein
MFEPEPPDGKRDRVLEAGTDPKECSACGGPLVATECEACAEAHRIFELALAWARANAEELAQVNGGELTFLYAIGAYFDHQPAEEKLVEAYLERLRSNASRSGPEQA